jgi:hypothetical protein
MLYPLSYGGSGRGDITSHRQPDAGALGGAGRARVARRRGPVRG